MNYIQYKQWADHWESLQHQAINSSLEDDDELDELNEFYGAEDDDKEDDGEVAAIFLAVAICLLSVIIAMIISA
jgi:hypothetical protein